MIYKEGIPISSNTGSPQLRLQNTFFLRTLVFFKRALDDAMASISVSVSSRTSSILMCRPAA